VVGDQVGDLTGGIAGGGVADLDDEVGSVRVVADAEGGPGDRQGGGFGRPAEGFNQGAFALAAGGVDQREPRAAGVPGQRALEDQLVKAGKAGGTVVLPGDLGPAPAGEAADLVCGERAQPGSYGV